MGQRESVKKYLRNVSLIYVFFGFKHILYKCKDMQVGLSENMFVIKLILSYSFTKYYMRILKF